MHGGCLRSHVSDEFLELFEGSDILEDDDWRSQKEDELEDSVEAATRVTLSLLQTKG